jgi:hypothetical protein
MICQTRDGYMRKLIATDLMISWKIVLTDGTAVYGDYDRPGLDNPWFRLKDHCKQNNVVPKSVELHMFGAPKKVFFENEDGLDGLLVMRGMAKDQSMDGSHSQSFQTLTVSLLRDDCSMIDVAKYTWPFNEFEKDRDVRVLTEENLKNMIFKNGSEKLKHPKVQELINGTTV